MHGQGNNIRNFNKLLSKSSYFYCPSWSKTERIETRNQKKNSGKVRKSDRREEGVGGRGGIGRRGSRVRTTCPAMGVMGFTETKQNDFPQYCYFETIKFYWFVCTYINHNLETRTKKTSQFNEIINYGKTYIGKNEFLINKVVINTSMDKIKILQSSLRIFQFNFYEK